MCLLTSVRVPLQLIRFIFATTPCDDNQAILDSPLVLDGSLTSRLGNDECDCALREYLTQVAASLFSFTGCESHATYNS